MLDGLTIHSFCRSFSHFSKSNSNLAANVRRYFGDWLTTGAAHWFGRFSSWTKFIAKCTDWNECSTIRLIYMCVSGARRPGGRSLLLISDLNCEKKKKINLILWRDRRCDAIHGYREFISLFFRSEFALLRPHSIGPVNDCKLDQTRSFDLWKLNFMISSQPKRKLNTYNETAELKTEVKYIDRHAVPFTVEQNHFGANLKLRFFFSFLLSSFCR